MDTGVIVTLALGSASIVITILGVAWKGGLLAGRQEDYSGDLKEISLQIQLLFSKIENQNVAFESKLRVVSDRSIASERDIENLKELRREMLDILNKMQGGKGKDD